MVSSGRRGDKDGGGGVTERNPSEGVSSTSESMCVNGCLCLVAKRRSLRSTTDEHLEIS